jgi:hypothetical protein
LGSLADTRRAAGLPRAPSLSRSSECGLQSPDEIPPEATGSQKRWFAALALGGNAFAVSTVVTESGGSLAGITAYAAILFVVLIPVFAYEEAV